MARKKQQEAELEGPKVGDDMNGNASALRAARAGQDRLDGGTISKAWEAYKDVAAEHAKAAQVWKNAQETAVVRGDDLIKVHSHRPFDNQSAARVAKECAKAMQGEKAALANKREAKSKLDEAWATVQSFSDEAPVRPLIPDEDEAEEET